jgi:hypothetical protein
MRLRNHEILGKSMSYDILQMLDQVPELTQNRIIEILHETAPEEHVVERIRDLESIAFLRVSNLAPPVVTLTDLGREAYLLAHVINGATLDSVASQLSRLGSSAFSLISEDITGAFIEALHNRRHVEELYVCSPWIRLRGSERRMLHLTLTRQKTRIYVITRPPGSLANAPASWRSQVLDTLKWLSKLGATLVKHPKLHTKLYCAVGKDWNLAIFGSENLTGAKNIELGIRVDDDIISQKLLRYYNRLYSQCDEILEEELTNE